MNTQTFDFQTLDAYIHSYFTLTSYNYTARLKNMYKPIKENKYYFQVSYNVYHNNPDGTLGYQEYMSQLDESQIINIINYINKSTVIVGRLCNVKQGQILTQNDDLFAVIDSFDVTLVPNEIKENSNKLELK